LRHRGADLILPAVAIFRNAPRITWRAIPLVLVGLIAGAFLLSPAVGQAAAFLTKKRADRRYLGNNTVLTSTATAAPDEGTSLTVPCPPGQQATGGGVDSPLFGNSSMDALLIQESKPVVTGTRTSGWNVEVYNATSGPVSITAYAVCSP
jgi:hypothetical protein